MRKVIGIGETILDILFRDGQPQAAVPGGSVYNAVISLGRMGQNVTFISETGNDRVGEMILANMRENGVDTANVNVFPEGKSPRISETTGIVSPFWIIFRMFVSFNI